MNQDADANSCYYSASASHTDNYCSTDEHDPLVPTTASRSLNYQQSSDSGADISEECHYAVTPHDHLPPHSGAIHTAHCHQRRHDFQSGRSNSLPSSAIDACEMNRMWEVFWASSGEQIIWSSWIAKFGEFINPEYTQIVDEKEEEPSTDFKANHTETEIRISSCSPAAAAVHPEINSFAADHLLSPRCESVTSSIPITIATTDSMTNVTHLTLSSGDFARGTAAGPNHFQSSSESESLNSSEMLTSSSSNSSQSPEDELLLNVEEAKVFADLCTTSGTRYSEDDAMDSDQHWQILWQKHFQEQYTEQYRQFMETKRAEAQSGSSVPESSFDEVQPAVVQGGSTSRRSSRRQRRVVADLPELVSGLNIADGVVETEACDGEGGDGNGPPEEVSSTNPDVDVMASMGLPAAFGSSKPVGGGGGGGGDGNRNPNEKGVGLKRR